jgi:hypothetical protein
LAGALAALISLSAAIIVITARCVWGVDAAQDAVTGIVGAFVSIVTADSAGRKASTVEADTLRDTAILTLAREAIAFGSLDTTGGGLITDRIRAGREVSQDAQTIRVDAAAERVAVLPALTCLDDVLCILSRSVT